MSSGKILDLAGKTALVTGGNRGIGKSIALRLARRGARVGVTGRNPETLTAAENELRALAPGSFALKCDVRSLEQQLEVFAAVRDRFGSLDICVPNAGEATLAAATETNLEQWRRDIDTNLTGFYITAVEAMKMMKERERGAIIGIVSKAGKTAFLLRAAYCASKWGALGFLKCLALEGKSCGVKVTAICPASVATDFQKNNPAGTDWMMSAEAVADAAEYVLSLEENAWIDELVVSVWKK